MCCLYQTAYSIQYVVPARSKQNNHYSTNLPRGNKKSLTVQTVDSTVVTTVKNQKYSYLGGPALGKFYLKNKEPKRRKLLFWVVLKKVTDIIMYSVQQCTIKYTAFQSPVSSLREKDYSTVPVN
jgi:hypothetical protein